MKSVRDCQKKAENRIEYIDIAKAIGIILVIVGHVVSSDTTTKRIIYAFHMPLFFMLSGMLLNVEESYDLGNWKAFTTKKAKALLLPYIVWALVYSSLSFKHIALILYGTREALIFAESLTSLWFLPVMYLGFILAELVLQFSIIIHKQRSMIVVIFGTLLFSIIGFFIPHHIKYGNPWGIDVSFIAAVFLLLGMIVKKWIIDSSHGWTAKLLVLAVSTAIFVITVKFSTSSVGYVLMANAEYGNAFLFFTNAISGSLIVILLSCLFFGKVPLARWIGKRTLGIFVVHKPFVELGRIVVSRMGYNYNGVISVISITVVTLILSGLVVAAIERIIPEIIGIKKKLEGRNYYE